MGVAPPPSVGGIHGSSPFEGKQEALDGHEI